MKNRLFDEKEVVRRPFEIGYSTGIRKIGQMTNTTIVKAADRETAIKKFKSTAPADYAGVILMVKKLT